MNVFSELRRRRILQILSGYIVASWGFIQFISFVEDRYQLSPHLVDAAGVLLLLALPSVVLMTWCHGRPGPDPWTKVQRVFVPANLIVGVGILLLLFGGKDLGAVTTTVAVPNEEGELTERVVPKQEYRRRILLFALEVPPEDSESRWLGSAAQLLMLSDLAQDPFLSFVIPQQLAEPLERAGFPRGHGAPLSLQQQLAEERSAPYFTNGRISRTDDGFRLTTRLYETARGTQASSHDFEGPDLYALIDQATLQLRRDLGIPESFLETTKDLPAGEMQSLNLDAVRAYVEGIAALIYEHDFLTAQKYLDRAVELDPTFAEAHYLRYVNCSLLQNGDGAKTAIESAMKYDYRLSDRLRFVVKANYYVEVREDPEKALSVVKMWASFHPDDAEAYVQLGGLHHLRGENEEALVALRRGSEVDPSRKEFLESIGRIEQEMGRFEAAEATFRRLAEQDPQNADYLANLARVRLEQGDLNGASETYERAMLLDLERIDLRINHIGVLRRLGDARVPDLLAEALEDAQTTADSVRVLAALADFSARIGRTEEAIRVSEVWSELAVRTTVPLRYWLSRALNVRFHSDRGDHATVVAQLDFIRQQIQGPASGVAGAAFAEVYLEIGQPDSAAANVDRLDEFIGRYQFEALRGTSNLFRGRIAEEHGDCAAALDFYAKEESSEGLGADLLLRRGRCQRKSGDLPAALASLSAASALDPAHPEVRVELARVHEAAGRLPEAREELGRALDYWKDADADFVRGREAREMAERLGIAS